MSEATGMIQGGVLALLVFNGKMSIIEGWLVGAKSARTYHMKLNQNQITPPPLSPEATNNAVRGFGRSISRRQALNWVARANVPNRATRLVRSRGWTTLGAIGNATCLPLPSQQVELQTLLQNSFLMAPLKRLSAHFHGRIDHAQLKTASPCYLHSRFAERATHQPPNPSGLVRAKMLSRSLPEDETQLMGQSHHRDVLDDVDLKGAT